MKKCELIICEDKPSLGVYSITVFNARYQAGFAKFIKKIVNRFLRKELFFSFYRVDCIHLSLKQQKKLETEIPLFFYKNGMLQEINGYLSIAKAELNDELCDLLPFILDYYSEISLFNPKVDWDKLKNYHLDYLNHRVADIISNHFTDIVFDYFDSGDISLYFNSQIFDSEEVKKIVVEAFDEMNRGDCS